MKLIKLTAKLVLLITLGAYLAILILAIGVQFAEFLIK